MKGHNFGELIFDRPAPALAEKLVQPCPGNTLSFTHQYSRNRWQAEIDQEREEALKKLNEICRRGKRSPRKDEYQRICTSIEEKYVRRDYEIAAKVALWEHSERCLNLLRTKGLACPTDEQRQNALFKFVHEIKLDAFPELKVMELDQVGIRPSGLPKPSGRSGEQNSEHASELALVN